MGSGTFYPFSYHLYVRINEQVAGKLKVKRNTPLGAHRTETLRGDFEVEVSILAQESKSSGRKTLEALWINFKNSK